MIHVDVMKDIREALHKLNPLKPCQLRKKKDVKLKWEGFVFHHTASRTWAFLGDGGGSVVISWEDYTWPGVSWEQYCYPSGVQRGVTLWGGAKTLVHFHRPRWHKFSLTRWYDCQSAPSAQWGEQGRGQKTQRAEPLWSFLEAGLLLFVTRHHIPCPDSCQSCLYLYAKHVNKNTLSQHFQIHLLASLFFKGCLNKDDITWNYLLNLLMPIFPLERHVCILFKVAASVARSWRCACWLTVKLSWHYWDTWREQSHR